MTESKEKPDDTAVFGEAERVVHKIAEAVILLLFVHAYFKQINISRKRVISIADEMAVTRKNIAFFKSPEILEEKLARVQPIIGKLTQWNYTFRHANGAQRSVCINSQSDSILKQVNIFSELALILNKQLSNSTPRQLDHLKSYPHPEPPNSRMAPLLQFMTTWFPIYCSAEMDAPSKARWIECSIAVICLWSYLFDSQINEVSSFTPIFLRALLSFREAKLLKEQQTSFELRGIQRRITAYDAFLPTCIGQQLTAQYLFVGDNTTLQQHVNFLMDMSNYIEKLETCVEASGMDPSDIPILPACITARKNMLDVLELKEECQRARFSYGQMV